ncbi:hypothetical protein EZV76_00265 [Flagellimonas alvinocaridis]|uniref:Uncharacterized protein n=1 Tax=Flagellimonas alvinocaridis TaxID=2530200 RepID=A0A4S8RRE6_9FLAO|nr:hypothetical protein [Allomuricauda alvinocaridis]THV60810.1 hypothetical protein EZV76_00265 [Allomuricauda alvinocaridis]
MKIRIKGNSVRFRLTQSEVKQLSETGSVMETTEFEQTTFVYEVQLEPTITELQASFFENTIIMKVPKDMGIHWFDSDTVGFENRVVLTNGNQLHLLLEKDFTCLENTSEDQSDNYPNPKLQC